MYVNNRSLKSLETLSSEMNAGLKVLCSGQKHTDACCVRVYDVVSVPRLGALHAGRWAKLW
jgi:hypothetical protein